MWSGYLDRKSYAMRAGIAFALVLAWPWIFSQAWPLLRAGIAHDARGAVQLIAFVFLKSGVTVLFALYMLTIVARRLRHLGSNPYFAFLICGLYAVDVVKFLTVGYQAYLMPSFLAPQWGPIALGMMAMLALLRDPQDEAASQEGGSLPLRLVGARHPVTRSDTAPATADFGRRNGAATIR